MKTNRNYGLYAIAAAIAIVGALALGVSPATLALLAVVAACPLMMFFMMRGMHGDSAGRDMQDRDPQHDHRSRPPGRK